MKKISVILFLLLPIALFCQSDSVAVNPSDSTKTIANDYTRTTVTPVVIPNDAAKTINASDSTKIKKMAIGISFSPDYCFRKLKPDADAEWLADGRDSREVAKFGYTVGATFAYKLNERLNISLGVLFSDSGEKTKKYSVDEGLPIGQEPIRYSYNYHHYYLNVPVKANYFILTGKLKVYVTLGVSANIFLNNKTTFQTHYANSTTKESFKSREGFSALNFSVLGGCGLNYPVNAKTTLMIEPIYRRSINSITTSPIKYYLYSGGINIGFLLKI